MNRTTRIAIGTVVLLLIVGAGFGAGFMVSRKLDPSSVPHGSIENNTNITSANTPYDPPKSVPNHKTYLYSPPSRGYAIRYVDVEKTTFNSGIANASIPMENSADVKLGQTALLFDKNGTAVPMLATVADIRPPAENTQGGPVEIKLAVQEPTFYSDALYKKARIITDKIKYAPRLPRESIVTGPEGKPYVWEVVKSQDGTHTAYFKPVDVVLVTDQYAVISALTPVSDDYILYPDENLKDGEKINARLNYYKGPEQTDDYYVEQALNRLIEEKFMATAKDFESIPRGAQTPYRDFSKVGGASGCGMPPTESTKFILSIQKQAAPAQLPQKTLPLR